MPERLKKRRDFLAAAKGHRAARRAFVLEARSREDADGPRFGFTVSKRTATKAVERNRIRRRLREAVQACRARKCPPRPRLCAHRAPQRFDGTVRRPYFRACRSHAASSGRGRSRRDRAGRGGPIDEEQPERHHRDRAFLRDHRRVAVLHHRPEDAGGAEARSPKSSRRRVHAERDAGSRDRRRDVRRRRPLAGAPSAAPAAGATAAGARGARRGARAHRARGDRHAVAQRLDQPRRRADRRPSPRRVPRDRRPHEPAGRALLAGRQREPLFRRFRLGRRRGRTGRPDCRRRNGRRRAARSHPATT